MNDTRFISKISSLVTFIFNICTPVKKKPNTNTTCKRVRCNVIFQLSKSNKKLPLNLLKWRIIILCMICMQLNEFFLLNQIFSLKIIYWPNQFSKIDDVPPIIFKLSHTNVTRWMHSNSASHILNCKWNILVLLLSRDSLHLIMQTYRYRKISLLKQLFNYLIHSVWLCELSNKNTKKK